MKSKRIKKPAVSNLCSTERNCVLIESSLILAWVEVTLKSQGCDQGSPCSMLARELYCVVGAQQKLKLHNKNK